MTGTRELIWPLWQAAGRGSPVWEYNGEGILAGELCAAVATVSGRFIDVSFASGCPGFPFIVRDVTPVLDPADDREVHGISYLAAAVALLKRQVDAGVWELRDPALGEVLDAVAAVLLLRGLVAP